jgi:hypothetical protein
MAEPTIAQLVASHGSIRRVAEALDIPVTTLHQWARGERRPPSYVERDLRARVAALPILGDGRRREASLRTLPSIGRA